jgi:hypothetical protein
MLSHRGRYEESDLTSVRKSTYTRGQGLIPRRRGVLVKTEGPLDALALAAMRAEELAITSPEYEALTDAVGYALDLADFAHAAQTHLFADLELPEDR